MKIKVTEEDIKDGDKGSPFCCPIALAVFRVNSKEEFTICRTQIGVCGIYIRIDNTYYKVPDKVKQFITKFDNGRKVSPIEFELTEKLN